MCVVEHETQGEAVAFALGGSRKMLRAGSLAALLNQEMAAAGHRTAEVRCATSPRGVCPMSTILASSLCVCLVASKPLQVSKLASHTRDLLGQTMLPE